MSDLDSTSKPWSQDCMGRKGIAKFLASHLDKNPKIRVLNLNSPWGSGKTFFLKNWKEEQFDERACVYFNAWERDFTGDAFVSLVAAIREQLEIQIGPMKGCENLLHDFTRKASRALIAATPALAKGLVKKTTGVEISVLISALDQDALGDAAEKAVEKLIETNKESISIVEDFKKVLGELVELAVSTKAAGTCPKPLYLFIDELDRCRPTFAVELLERIKHLFDVPNCKFIIATDTIQLGHAVTAIYGSGFNASKYLKRFFDAEFKLDNGDKSNWIAAHLSEDQFESSNPINVRGSLPDQRYFPVDYVSPDPDTILSKKIHLTEEQLIFLALAETFRCEFRELEKIIVQISAVKSSVRQSIFHFFWAAYLVVLKDESPSLYDTALNGVWADALVQIESRYPPKKLYFGNGLYTVHKIFEFYLSLYRGGEKSAHELYRNTPQYDQEFKRLAVLDFRSNFNTMTNYPKLVDLAHSLE